MPLSLGRAGTATELQREELIMAEYMQNLSHVRHCWTMQDSIRKVQPLILPKLKLAFCFIPKVACSQFKDLFNRLNNLDSAEGFGKTYLDSTPRHLGFPIANISRDNGWKFAAFTRDPALRYLSAWGSACVSTGTFPFFEHIGECCGPLVWDSTLSPDTIAGMFEARVMADLRDGVAALDDHWVAQVQVLDQCGWERFDPSKLDFHGHLHLDMNSQVKAMLKMVGHSDDRLVDRLFPNGDGIAGHRSPLRHLEPEDLYRSARTLEAMKKLYEEDYEALEGIGGDFTEPALALLREKDNSSADFRNADGLGVGSG